MVRNIQKRVKLNVVTDSWTSSQYTKAVCNKNGNTSGTTDTASGTSGVTKILWTSHCNPPNGSHTKILILMNNKHLSNFLVIVMSHLS